MVEELISKNVAALVTVGQIRKRSGKAKTWNSEEARRFLESTVVPFPSLDDADDWFGALDPRHYLYAAYVLVLVLGLRKGETLGLTWNDVDLDEGELQVRLQLQRVRGRLLHRETKTEESDAPLPLPGICVAALRRDLIFTTQYGRPVEPRNFNRSWDLRCGKAGLRKITVHDARRTCATLLVDLDVHPRVVMQILRHAQFAVTMEIYSQVSSQQTRDALKRLGDSLNREERPTGE